MLLGINDSFFDETESDSREGRSDDTICRSCKGVLYQARICKQKVREEVVPLIAK